jgi:hypothetical protein
MVARLPCALVLALLTALACRSREPPDKSDAAKARAAPPVKAAPIANAPARAPLEPPSPPANVQGGMASVGDGGPEAKVPHALSRRGADEIAPTDAALEVIGWDGPLFVMEAGSIELDTACIQTKGAPVAPFRWYERSAALGLTDESRVNVITDDGVRQASLQGLSCAHASDCLDPLVLLALSYGTSRDETRRHEVEGPEPGDIAAAAAGGVIDGEADSRRALPLAGEGLPACRPPPEVKAPAAGAECRNYLLRDAPPLYLQTWAFNAHEPEDYPYWVLHVRTRVGDSPFTAWRPLHVGSTPPDLWSITDRSGVVRVLMRASSAGVGSRTMLRMVRIDPKGEIDAGRTYSAGGAACD